MTSEPTELLPASLSVMDDADMADEASGRPLFSLAFRGYDREEVEQHLGDIAAQLARISEHRDALAREVTEARAALDVATAAEREAGHPSYRQMGERVAQIFALAEQEVAELKGAAQQDIDSASARAEQIVAKARAEGDELISRSRQAAAEIDADRDRRLADVQTELATRREALEAELATRRQALEADLAAIERRRDEVAEQLRAIAAKITSPDS